MTVIDFKRASTRRDPNCLVEIDDERAVICRDGQLRGAFGSVYDTCVFEILEGEYPEGAGFSDACVEEMIAEGKLREIEASGGV